MVSEIRSADQQKYGKRISPLIEKGLRAESEEEVQAALWMVALDERVCSYIQNDLFTQYVSCKRNLTLKSLWMYLRSILKYESKYDEQLMIDLLGRGSHGLSAYINEINTESELLEMLAGIGCRYLKRKSRPHILNSFIYYFRLPREKTLLYIIL